MERTTIVAENDGLTRPLINNIGGVIDQDAPSADQVKEAHPSAEGGRNLEIEGTHLTSADRGAVIAEPPTGGDDNVSDG